MTDPTTPAPSKKEEQRKPQKKAPVRDDGDLFIDEVSEELRREKLMSALWRFGPWVGAALVAVVIGVGVSEYLDYAKTQASRAFGEKLIAASVISADNEAAHRGAAERFETAAGEADSPQAAAVARLFAADARRRAGDSEAAAAMLSAIAEENELSPLYRHLATLKLVMLEPDEAPAAKQIEALTPLTTDGAPYRALALEQIALAHLRDSDFKSARQALVEAQEDSEATDMLRRRAQEVLDAMPAADDATE